MSAIDLRLGDEDYCYLTTVGRVSGEPREIEIWFGLDGDTIYMLSGGGERSNRVRNLVQTPAVTVRIAGEVIDGTARIVTEQGEDSRARTLLVDKYRTRYGGELSNWERTALPVAVDVRVKPRAGT